jgi:WD40 repeat protein
VQGFAVLPDWRTVLLAVSRTYPDPTKEPVFWDTEVTILWLDLDTGDIRRQVAVTPRLSGAFAIGSVVLSPDGRRLAIKTWYSGQGARADIHRAQISVLDTDSGATVTTIDDEALQIGVQSIAITPDSAHLVIATDRLILWDIASSRKRAEFVDRVGRMQRNFQDIKLSADGRTLATGGGDTIFIWNVTNQRVNRAN